MLYVYIPVTIYISIYPGSPKTKLCPFAIGNPSHGSFDQDQPLCLVDWTEPIRILKKNCPWIVSYFVTALFFQFSRRWTWEAKTTGKTHPKIWGKTLHQTGGIWQLFGIQILDHFKGKPIIEIFVTPIYQDDCGWPSAGPPPSLKTPKNRTVLEKYGIQTLQPWCGSQGALDFVCSEQGTWKREWETSTTITTLGRHFCLNPSSLF